MCRGHPHSRDNSPTSAAAVCRAHSLNRMITAPHQRLPCVEDSILSLIQGDRAPSRCMKSPRRKSNEGEELSDTATWKAHKGEESHDIPARKIVKLCGIAYVH